MAHGAARYCRDSVRCRGEGRLVTFGFYIRNLLPSVVADPGPLNSTTATFLITGQSCPVLSLLRALQPPPFMIESCGAMFGMGMARRHCRVFWSGRNYGRAGRNHLRARSLAVCLPNRPIPGEFDVPWRPTSWDCWSARFETLGAVFRQLRASAPCSPRAGVRHCLVPLANRNGWVLSSDAREKPQRLGARMLTSKKPRAASGNFGNMGRRR